MILNNIKVKTKLITSFVVVALVSAVVGIFGISNMSKISAATELMFEKEVLGVSYIKDANLNLLEVARDWRSALLAKDATERLQKIEDSKTWMKKFEENLDKAKPLFYTQSGKDTFDNLEEAKSKWKSSMQVIYRLIPNENAAALSPEFDKVAVDAREQLKDVNTYLGELGTAKVKNAQKASEDISALYQFSRSMMIGVIIFGVILGASIGYFISRLITRPLADAVVVAKKLSVADVSGEIDIPGSDELGVLLSSMQTMKESIKEGFIAAEANSRVKQALDATSSNVMVADVNRNIVYMNPAVMNMLRVAEADIRAVLPHFAVDKILGSNMDIFHKNPAHQMKLLENLSTSYASNIVVGKRHFRLVANPIFFTDGTRLGSVVEWQDRTQEIAVESEVSDVVQAAAAGNFTARIPLDGKAGFFLTLAEGLNSLMQTAEIGLGEVNRVLGAIAKGDLTEKITTDYSGTFGELKDYCNSTTNSLSEIIGEIRGAAETIYTASSEIAQGNADLSSRTEQQAANLEETASSMEELTSTVKLNADNAKQANVLAEQACTVAIDGGTLIEDVVTTMSSINDSSQKIADIIGVIDGIAFQTNILALNAAVEAARAGDQGRGFAVVASEVRTLAQRSANAAKDIKGLISDSVKKIENGNVLVSKSGDTMKDIVTAIKRVNDIMSEIAAASVEQSSGIEEVSTAVSQMDEMTQQNAALVEQAAAAAESLQSQADQLNRSVSRFRLGDNHDLPVPSIRTSPPRAITKSPIKPAAKTDAAKASVANKKLIPPASSAEDEWEQF
ncbi:methyl-accepting chemotaxis protein [Cellvibrio mixtus]|uniref:methyl-accepting chemotaxis protein n=1 Tax=Cellvibrio mixtus TaxID=39650 RepID=UPI0009FBE2F2|nr:methyl-accepting chemotaxis protein [Cellvibrio mixtus]